MSSSIVTLATTINEDKIAGLSQLIIQLFMHLKRVLDHNFCQRVFFLKFFSLKIVFLVLQTTAS